MFSLKLLGPPRILGEGGEDLRPSLGGPKRLGVLSYIAICEGGRPVQRDSLLAMFWPELDTERARRALRQALHGIRSALSDSALNGRGSDYLCIDPQVVRCDVLEFKQALDGGNLRRAVELYAGAFLDGFHLAGEEGFEEWLSTRRRTLHGQACDAALGLAAQAYASNDGTEAVSWARAGLSMAPDNERAVQLLLRALSLVGDRAGAVAEYERFATRLVEGYDLEPSFETTALIERIRAGQRPRRRVQDSSEVGSAVAPLEPDQGKQVARKDRRTWTILAGIVGLSVMMAGVVLSRVLDSDQILVRNRVAVAPFVNHTEDRGLDLFGELVSTWITQGLTQSGGLEVVSSRGVLATLARAPEGPERDRITWLGHQLKAKTVVDGTYNRVRDSLEFRAHVIDIPTGNVRASIPAIRVDTAAARDALEPLRQRILGMLATELDQRLEAWSARAVQPPRYDAYEAFAIALDQPLITRVQETTVLADLDWLNRAFQLDPTFTLAKFEFLYSVALTYCCVGDSLDLLADSILTDLEHGLDQLSRSEQMEVRGLRALMSGNKMRYYLALREIASIAPDRWLAYADMAFHLGRYGEAIEIYRRDDLPQTWRPSGFPRKHLTASLHHTARHAEELITAREYRKDSLYGPTPEAFEQEITALVGLGRISEADSVFTAAISGLHGQDEGHLLSQFLDELYWHGHEESAVKYLSRMAELSEQNSDHYRLARTRLRQGRLEEARHLYRNGIARFSPNVPRSYRVVGVGAAQAGDLELAKMADSIFVELDSRLRVGLSPFYRSQIAGAMGDCEKAAELLREALSRGKGHFHIHRRHGFLSCLGDPEFLDAARPSG